MDSPFRDMEDEILVKMESLIGSKSSDYNKGVQDCINIFKEKKESVIHIVSGPTRDEKNPWDKIIQRKTI